jgi:hypothetical protein
MNADKPTQIPCPSFLEKRLAMLGEPTGWLALRDELLNVTKDIKRGLEDRHEEKEMEYCEHCGRSLLDREDKDGWRRAVQPHYGLNCAWMSSRHKSKTYWTIGLCSMPGRTAKMHLCHKLIKRERKYREYITWLCRMEKLCPDLTCFCRQCLDEDWRKTEGEQSFGLECGHMTENPKTGNQK